MGPFANSSTHYTALQHEAGLRTAQGRPSSAGHGVAWSCAQSKTLGRPAVAQSPEEPSWEDRAPLSRPQKDRLPLPVRSVWQVSSSRRTGHARRNRSRQRAVVPQPAADGPRGLGLSATARGVANDSNLQGRDARRSGRRRASAGRNPDLQIGLDSAEGAVDLCLP